MDVERIWDKACALGISHHEERDGYRDEDVLLLTCTPGFSTAAHATRVSGRGVGMDVVKGKIEHLGGSLEIKSRYGSGTEIEMTLPLTLAIIQALLVSAAEQTFALPLGVVDEVLDPAEITTGTIDGAAVLIGREGAVVPLIRLDVALGMAEPTGAPPVSGEHIVLMQDASGVHRGLIVGGLHGRTEVVIKPLTRLVRDAHGIGGATVLGDGRVALILDTRTIFREGVGDR
jgi:two-component system chemotaxis sensor kinase CheA